MLQIVIVTGFAVAALINFLPVSGVLGTAQLMKLYDISLEGRDLAILMRHRAVLFGVVGGVLVAAIFLPGLRVAALLVGMLSMTSFIALQWLEGGSNTALSRVVVADYVGIAFLAAAGIAMYLKEGNA